MNPFLQEIFPTAIFSGRCNNLDVCKKAENLAQLFRKNAKNAGLVSNQWDKFTKSSDQKDFDQYGVTSFNSGSLLDIPEWEEVIFLIHDFATTMLSSIHRGQKKLVIANAWTTVYPTGTFVPEHVHSNSTFSGAFYVKAPENCGNIVFHDPAYLAKTMYLGPSLDSSMQLTRFEKKVETGMMVIFPSWLPHYTLPNESSEDRIMISFNMDLI